MAYFERTLKELHDNIAKLTDYSLSGDEFDELGSLHGQLDFSQTWTEADFNVLDGAVGIVLENKLTDDFRDIIVQFQNKIFDVVNYPRPKGRELRASTQRTCLVQDRAR